MSNPINDNLLLLESEMINEKQTLCENLVDSIPQPPDGVIETTGDYKNIAFFTQDNYVELDENGYVMEWEPYEDVNEDAANFDSRTFKLQYGTSSPDVYWPNPVDQFRQLRGEGSSTFNSTFFTPEFTYDTYIQGKVFFLVPGDVWYSATSDWYLQMTLDIFDPVTNTTTNLGVTSKGFNDTEYNERYNGAYKATQFSITIPSTTLIPAGNRLRAIFRGMIDSSSFDYLNSERIIIRSGTTTYQTIYVVDDTNSTFENVYTLETNMESIGMQLYIYQETFPTIDLANLQNNTTYSDARSGVLSVSSSATESKYHWNTDSDTFFVSSTTVDLPLEIGWHTLTVSAKDQFNNSVTAIYYIGYDPFENKVILYSPANNSIVTDGQTLNISIEVDINFAYYQWDKTGDDFFIGSEKGFYEIPLDDSFVGLHQLTIYVNDEFGESLTEFFFTFDNNAPVISLNNVINGTTQAQGKNIDFTITDLSSPIEVLYRWNSDDYASLSPIEGSLYRTYLPSDPGWHYLTIQANDTFGQQNIKLYAFNTSQTLLNVELSNMVNNSYYQGGNTVEITVINFNGTCYYSWDNDPWTLGTLVGNILTLDGADALSSVPGIYNLSIRVFDNADNMRNFTFVFTVDQEAPTIIQTNPVPDYNDSRLLTSTILDFTITDDYLNANDINVLYSINSGSNKSLLFPFEIYLDGYSDGNYTLTIFANDIAGNSKSYYISFVVDSTKPTFVDIDIIGDVTSDSDIVYIPSNCQVIVNVFDDDPQVKSYYSWNDSTYLQFTNSFFLPSLEGLAQLSIKANDTLGNTRIWNKWLTIDPNNPRITLQVIANNSKINEFTPLKFKITDASTDTLSSVIFKWDLVTSSPTTPFSLYDFTTSIEAGHLTKDDATLWVYAQDLVGNIINLSYYFSLDFNPPDFQLFENTNNSYVRGNSVIYFNVTSIDLLNFRYSWDGSDLESLVDPWNITVPIDDGNHSLYVYLEDDCGGGIYTNSIEAEYVFIVDDIEIIFANPSDLTNNYYHSMIYGDSFTFSLNIRDAYNKSAIPTLVYDIYREHSEYNLIVDVTQTNSTMYYFTVQATNITQGSYSYINFEFYQFSGNSQSVVIHFLIHRKQGNVVLIDVPESVVYEQNITLTFQLKDNLNISGQNIELLKINDQTTGFNYQLIDAEEYIYNLSFNTKDFFPSKGNTSFSFYMESHFYFGVQNDTSAIEIAILPIPIILSVDVNNVQIIENNQLVVSAILTRGDTTPVPFAELTFYFYIYLKDGSARAAVIYLNAEDYDDVIVNTTTTDTNGQATMAFLMTENIASVKVMVEYSGNDIYDPISNEFSQSITTISAGLSLQLILIIVGAAVLFSIIVGFAIYRLVRAKPFDELMGKISEEEINKKMIDASPGVILTIFDQAKGPIPLLEDHSLEESKYKPRMRIGVENFLLKISDQAYSSLGFEEHDDRRRIGSINLPNEDMIGFIHGIQLPNKMMRGGFENLALIVLADNQYGSYLLANQEFLFPEIDELIEALKQKQPLGEIKALLALIRRRSIIIMLAGKKADKKSDENNGE
jgi:hypothetical protein